MAPPDNGKDLSNLVRQVFQPHVERFDVFGHVDEGRFLEELVDAAANFRPSVV